MRVHKEQSFVIHTRPYSETSLYVELFSRGHGRLMVIARGARRQKSPFRGALLPFRRLLASWTGRGEIPTLTLAEPAARWTEIRGQGAVCGFYVNELVIKLLHRYDAHPQLFDDYTAAMERFQTGAGYEGALRLFEKRLLGELGYAMNLDHEVEGGRPITAAAGYRFIPALGAVAADSERQGGVAVSGAALRALKTETFSNDAELQECKRLMRAMISHQLEHRVLCSRKMLR